MCMLRAYIIQNVEKQKCTEFGNCERSFFRAFALSMVNTWLSLFSPYFRKFENDVLGYSFWWILNQFMWLDSRYFSWGKIQVLTLWSSRKEGGQPGAEERKAEAKEEREAETKEGYEKEVSRFKARKEISLIYFQSIRWVWCQIQFWKMGTL